MSEQAVHHVEERRVRWASRDEAALMDYAACCGEPLDPVDVEELDWIYIDALPVSFLGTPEYWRTFWEQQAGFHEPDRLALWQRMLTETIRDPIVISMHERTPDGEDATMSWDGLHRTAATVLSGRSTIPAIVGLVRGLGLEDLPGVVRDIPQIVERIGRPSNAAMTPLLTRIRFGNRMPATS